MMLEPATRDAVHGLWDELVNFDAAQAEESRNRLFEGVSALIDACNATWIGAVRMNGDHGDDPVMGWRPRVVRQWRPDSAYERLWRDEVKKLEAGVVDETTIRNVEKHGNFRTNLLSDLAPPGWFDGPYYHHFYLSRGYRDAIWAGVPVNEDAEVYFGFYRGADQHPFTIRDRDTVAYALRPLKWLQRTQLLSEGIGVASAPLSPMERQVLRAMLSGQTEKQIADANGYNPHTTHVHVKRILRKYGVTSRSRLMALWLGR